MKQRGGCSAGLLAVAAVGLMATSVAGARADIPKAFKPEWIPQLAVPRMSKPPVLDGAIGPEEWREAAAVSGVADVGSNKIVPRPTTYFLGWDAGHLYLACRTYLRPGYKPAVHTGRDDGLAYTFDDGMEFVWKPMGRNVVNRNAAYKFFVNCIGFKGDTCRLTLGQMFKDWNPRFKTAWRLTESGSAPNGGRWWELEMSSTPEDFELQGEHQAGDEWRLMLGFNHIPGWMQARLPCLGSYFDDSGGGYPRAMLVENTPAVQFLMDSLDNLATDGTAAMTIRAFNPAATEAKVDIAVDVAGAIVKTETLTVPAGGEAAFKLAQKLPAEITDGMARVTATAAGKTLLSYTTFFQVGFRPDMLAPVKPPDPNQFGFTVNFSPVRRLLQLSGDTWFFDKPEEAATMAWTVYPQGAPKKAMASGTVDRTVLWRFQDLVALPTLKAGTYTVEGAITMKDGTTRGPMTATILKKDEAREYPAWWGKRFGDPDAVIPPFQAIQRLKGSGFRGQGGKAAPSASPEPRTLNPDTFSCWGREYAPDGLGLPRAVRSQGREVLAASARVVVRAGGADTAIEAGAARIVEQKDWRVRFEGQATGAGLAFSSKGWLEQDGLVYVELTYGPAGSAPVAVEALSLEYPLAEDDADALVCIGPGGNFSSMTAMLLPRDKPGSLWSTLVTGQPGARMAKGSFYPTVWVGSERRGFLWWGDNDRGWFPENDVPAHEVVRVQGSGSRVQEGQGASSASPEPGTLNPDSFRVVLRNHIIGKPVTLAERHTIAFSYMATPFRPFTKGWRAVNATDDGTFGPPFRSVRKDSKTGDVVNKGGHQMNWIHPESRYPEEWDALWADQKTNAVCMGYRGADACVRASQWFDPYAARSGVSWQHMSFTLFGWGPKTIEDHLFQYFTPGQRWDCEYDESFLNYALYLFDGAFGKGGVVQTYWDITFPTQNDNPVSGLCYLLPDGRLQPGYVGWNARRFYQRLQSLMARHQLVPDGSGGHSTQAYLTVAMPWMDAVLDGELNFNIDVSDRDWIDYYPVARMRAMSSPHNWGVPICWMGHLDSADRAKTEFAQVKRAEYLWMHDSWKNPYGGAGRTVMPDTILDFGLNGDATAYHPYWRNPYVAGADPNLLVSIWRLADRDDPGMVAEAGTGRVDRVLVGVFNYDRAREQQATLKIDLGALGLSAPDAEVVARDLYGPEPGMDGYYRGGGGNHAVSGLSNTATRLDVTSGTLALAPLAPHRGRFVGLRLERRAETRRVLEALKSVAAEAGAPEPADLPEAALIWGATEPGAAFSGLGKAPAIVGTDPTVRAAAWAWRDRVLLAVVNTGDKPLDAVLKLDLTALNLTPRLPWQEFARLRDFTSEPPGGKAAPAVLDFHGGTLTIKAFAPRTVRLIGLRRY